jgi:hypothetical protein
MKPWLLVSYTPDISSVSKHQFEGAEGIAYY